MKIAGPQKAPHARLSATGARFLEFVERHPECLRRSSFPQMEPSEESFAPFALQSWPIFVDRPLVSREFERAATGIPRLIRSLPERIFDNDAEKVGEFYGLDRRSARLLVDLLKQRRIRKSFMARGDYVYGEEGLKCMEVNMAALGGLQSADWAAAYRRVPLISRFLAEEGADTRCRDTVDVLLSYMYRETRSLASGGELNLAFRLKTGEKDQPTFRRFIPIYERNLDQRWQELLTREGFEGQGRMMLCEDRELEMDREMLFGRGRRIHGVVEYSTGLAPRTVLIPWMVGNLRLCNGPLKQIFGDKRNLALLSELADSDLFTSEERTLIQRHVPWTRPLRADRVRFREREMPMLDLLVAERERLVLKPARGSKGEGIHVGRTVSEDAWRRTASAAMRDGGYLVQEFVESLPFLLQEGDVGCGPHSVVWGLFCYGEDYGGGFLRVSALSRREAIVNTERGALEGAFFEVSRS